MATDNHESGELNPFLQMTKRLEKAAGLIAVDSGIYKILAEPFQELAVSMRTGMDTASS